ncbi:hypothetical protein [Desulfallas thermosapovorans]|uniref:Uncharacterized protein n=1 Tax=Desulfallas thermosapovorans DSM 6562 TaxID=1121431 RepID=A0A5S4ZPD6_9FIRM|nr:hypothetical protein [Desulfallas thermosapovorans]TYO94521.1 hypothetical protein LX24_02357 [Desulfallas thermosapovorans DSM 6562]
MVHKLIDPDLKQCLPEEYRKNSPLDTLENARSWLSPIYDPDDGPKYNELVDELDCHYNDLLQVVPVEKQGSFCDVFGLYLDCMNQLCAMEKENFYKTGLRDGFLLAVELLAVQGENKAINKTGLRNYP